jgi:5-methylcytosine-specific restriction endonuclease McrA
VKLGEATRALKQQRVMSAGSRHVPSAAKREVWARDGGQCAFVGAAGRCTETGFLEYHHVVPYADGGEATTANIQLRCRAHNAYEAGEWFGPLVARERGPHLASYQGTILGIV